MPAPKHIQDRVDRANGALAELWLMGDFPEEHNGLLVAAAKAVIALGNALKDATPAPKKGDTP